MATYKDDDRYELINGRYHRTGAPEPKPASGGFGSSGIGSTSSIMGDLYGQNVSPAPPPQPAPKRGLFTRMRDALTGRRPAPPVSIPVEPEWEYKGPPGGFGSTNDQPESTPVPSEFGPGSGGFGAPKTPPSQSSDSEIIRAPLSDNQKEAGTDIPTLRGVPLAPNPPSFTPGVGGFGNPTTQAPGGFGSGSSSPGAPGGFGPGAGGFGSEKNNAPKESVNKVIEGDNGIPPRMRIKEKFDKEFSNGGLVGIAAKTVGSSTTGRGIEDLGQCRYQGIGDEGHLYIENEKGDTLAFKIDEVIREDDDMIIFKNKGGSYIPMGDDGQPVYNANKSTGNLQEIMISKPHGNHYSRQRDEGRKNDGRAFSDW